MGEKQDLREQVAYLEEVNQALRDMLTDEVERNDALGDEANALDARYQSAEAELEDLKHDFEVVADKLTDSVLALGLIQAELIVRLQDPASTPGVEAGENVLDPDDDETVWIIPNPSDIAIIHSQVLNNLERDAAVAVAFVDGIVEFGQGLTHAAETLFGFAADVAEYADQSV